MSIRDRILRLDRVRAGDLRPNPANWRRHPKAQREALKGVLAEIGYAGALLARETPEGLELIDGHLRAELDPAQMVPVLVLDVDEAEARKLLVTIDPIGSMAQPDQDALLALLQQTEFQNQAVNDMLEGLANGETQPLPPLHDPGPATDRAEELRIKWGTERGQLWEIGKHRLMCGDATSANDHATLLNGQRVDLVLTDPPYGVGIDYGVGINVGTTFEDSPEVIKALIPQFMPYLCCWPVVLLIPGQMMMWYYPRPTWTLSWVIPAGGGQNPWGFTTWHAILAYGKDPYLAKGLGGRPDGITMMSTRDPTVEGHPVIKPLGVWKWLLERGSPAVGEIVLDPFLGSGTTMVAAEQLGRICYGMEIEPRYVAVTLERLNNMGLTPKLVEH